jgi:distribution and morphology protein 10
VRLHLSSLPSPNFATSYTLGSTPLVDGSLSYLYSSLPLPDPSASSAIDLHRVIRGYRQIPELRLPESPWEWERWRGGRRIDRRPSVLYGRLYLPQSTLEALYLRRTSPTTQIQLKVVSDARLRNGGTLLAIHQKDVGTWSTEGLYSTDGGLLGLKGLYNFGAAPAAAPPSPESLEGKIYGRFSAGAELYYGSLNKSGGMSVGGRFATLPGHRGIPLTATLTCNPLMGSVSATYAVRAGRDLALCSRFEFNAYSYESDLVVGMELWRRRWVVPRRPERSWDAKLAWGVDPEEAMVPAPPREEVTGVLKARVDTEKRLGVLWEGRMKDFLFSVGGTLDLRKRERMFGSLGLELQYSS